MKSQILKTCLILCVAFLASCSRQAAPSTPALAPTQDAVATVVPQENKNLLPDPVLVQKNGVVITVDPRLELMSIVQYLSDDNHAYMRKEGTSYSRRVKEYFEKYKNHPLIDFMNKRMLSRGFAYDAPVAAVLFLDSRLEPDTTLSIPQEYLGRFGGQATFLTFADELRQFALDTDYARFYRDSIPFYGDAINSMAQTLQGDNLPQELQEYFGVEYRSFTIDPVFLYVDHAGFGATIGEGKETQVYCIMGNGASADACRHEFSHSFVNRITSDNIDLAMKYSDLFGPIKQSMAEQAYDTWEITLDEHIIRAVHIRLGSTNNPLMEKWLLAAELSRGFIYIESIVDSLKEYEKNREKYQNLSKFYPVLLENLHPFEDR